MRKATDRLFHVVQGLHSRIPLCCVLAFPGRRGVPVECPTYPMGVGYIPCRRCAREIERGVRLPARVHECNAKNSVVCRMGEWWACHRIAAHSGRPCPACRRRGLTDAGSAEWYVNDSPEHLHSLRLKRCVWCDYQCGRVDDKQFSGVEAGNRLLAAFGIVLAP